MQLLAGIINESQLNEEQEVSPEKAIDAAEKISDKLAQDPDQLKQSLAKAQQAGISMDMIKQAAAQLKQGKSEEEIFASISNKVNELNNLKEISVDDYKKKELWGTMTTGAGLGAFAGAAALIVTGPTLIPIAVLALAGALIGRSFRDKSSGGQVSDGEIKTAAAWEFKNQFKDKGRSNTLPDKNLFYIVDNDDTPEELKGKEVWRFTVQDRDAVGDKEALFNS